MKQKFLLCVVALMFGVHVLGINLVLVKSNGKQELQNISAIGKLVYQGDNLQLISHTGEVLGEESVWDIRKITFAQQGTATNPENITDAEIVLYPNPTQDILIISGIEAQMLRVFDLQGRLLKVENGTQVGVADLADGTYLLQVGTQVVRFIKK